MPRTLVAFILFAGCAAWSFSPANAQEWTRFRGPNGQGESETSTIPASWTEKDLNWKVELPGIGHSSPVLWGEKIFLLSADPKTAARYLLCISAADGKTIWQKEYPGIPHHLHANSSYASCTPAVEADRLYVAWSDPEFTRFMALDHSGKEIWTLNLGPWVSQHGFGTSPMIYEDLVVMNCSQEASKQKGSPDPKESYVLAVEKDTGKIRWRTDRKINSASFSVPAVRQSEDGQDELICCTQEEGIFALDPKTGKEKWALPVFTMRTVSSPLLTGGLIMGSTGSGAGGHYLVALRPGKEPKVEYEVKRQAPYVPAPVAYGDLMFLFDDRQGFVSCINVADGKQLWLERVASQFFGSPVRAGDKLFCVDQTGVVVCLAASPVFHELGRTDLKEQSRSTPAIAGGRMYVRTISHLYSVGGK